MIHVVTDSTAQLTPEQIKENDIHVVPLQVTYEGKTYEDGVNLTKEQFSKMLDDDETEFPKTSQPSIGQFIETYENIQKEDPDAQIISIHITKALSGTVETAASAAQQVGGNIKVIDSGSIDCALTYVDMSAVNAIMDGKSFDEVIAAVNEMIPKVSTYVFINDFSYFFHGGRASRAIGFITSMIKFKAVVQVVDYKIKLPYKARGKKRFDQIINEMVDKVINDPSISHLGMSYVDSDKTVKEITKEINEKRPDIEITSHLASPITMTHVGNDGFGFIYY